MPGAVFLRGEAVTLRVVEPEDAEVIGRAHNDPDLRTGLLYRTPQDGSDVRSYIEGIANERDRSIDLLICLEGDGGADGTDGGTAVAGAINLFDVNLGHGEVSCWLFEEYQGQGYATEAMREVLDYAFDTLGLNHVHGQVIDYNVPCQDLVLGLGFDREGTRPGHVFRDGEYHDTYLYGTLADEWRERRDGE